MTTELLASNFANVVSYKEGGVDFTANNGLVVVSGNNKDSRISKKQNNGAGKSLLFSMLPNVFWEATPLAKTKNRKTLVDKESFISVDIRQDHHTYKITQHAGKYIIERDGEDLQVHSLAGQRARIAEILPVTEAEWYSYIYLQSQRPNAFQYGSPKARLSYITDVWSLDQYDRLHKYFMKQVGEVKKAQTEYDVHYQSLHSYDDKLNALGWTRKHAESLDQANTIIKKLGGRVKELQAVRHDLTVKQTAHKKQKEIRKRLKKLKADAKFTKKQLNALFAEITAYEVYVEAAESYKAKKLKFTKRLAEIGVVKPADTKALRKRLSVLKEEDAKQRSVREKFDEAKRVLENLDDHTDPDLRAHLSRHKKTSTDPLEALEEERQQLKAIIGLADLLHEHEDGSCPTCMQPINIKQISAQVKQAKKRLSKVASLKHALEIRNTEAKYKKIIDTLAFDDRAFYERRKEIKKIEEQLDAVEDDQDKFQESVEIKAKLDALEKPAPVKKPKYTAEELEHYVTAIKEIDKLTARQEKTEDCAEELAEVEEALSKIEQKYVRAFRMQTEYSSKKASYDLLSEGRNTTMKKLDELQPIIKKLQDYRVLAKAYGPGGLKMNATNNILFQLEETYNKYSGLIFAEPFKFKVFAKKDGVHALVDRGHGNKSDVRELSGAESDAFALLHFLACLVLAPVHKRMNIAILDEPDSHMDDVTASLLADRFIPFLRTMVPHIFLITQKGKHLYSDCSYINVVKHKGVSKVEYEQAH